MSSEKMEKIFHADEGHFYDTRSMDFEMNKVSAEDDYGLQRVPGNWRFSSRQAFWSWTGLSTAMAYPLTAALLTFAFGAPSVIAGFFITAILVAFGVYYMAKKSANEGLGKDLISRASFGYYGSVFTSLFGGLFLIILFALEASIMARSLSEFFPVLPYWFSAALICLVFLPIGIYGMVWINKIQNFTLWLYAIGLVSAIISLYAGWSDKAQAAFAEGWMMLNPAKATMSWATVATATGAWLGAFGFITMLSVTDVSRMVHRQEKAKAAKLLTFVSAVFNSILIGLFGIILLASTKGANPDPGVTFVWLLGPFGLLLVVITQLRINVINMYVGTLALDSAFAQVSKKRFIRSWLLVPFLIIGYLIVISPFLKYFPTIVSIAGVIFASWIGAIFGEQMLVRRKNKIPSWSEFRRAYLPSVNWIGFTSMVIPAILGIISILGRLGMAMASVAVLLTFVLSFVLPAIIASMMSREQVTKQYFARIPEIPTQGSVTMDCEKTGETYHKSDFVHCPFHKEVWISSIACATEAGCGKVCQSPASRPSISSQVNV